MTVATSPIAPYTRHPLSLPPGSVRAVLSLMIAGLFWLVLALEAVRPEMQVQIPLFLYFLTGMILLFIGAHGHTIGGHLAAGSPLGLPRGSIRAVLLLGSAAMFAWLFVNHQDRLFDILTPKPEQLKQWPTLLLTTVGSYSFGYLIGRGPWRQMSAFQDLLAWVSLIAMIGLAIETIWVVFINPSLSKDIDLAIWEAILTAVVSFYFGARA
jgi:hypothetical protein